MVRDWRYERIVAVLLPGLATRTKVGASNKCFD
jgi:hypothetical protein